MDFSTRQQANRQHVRPPRLPWRAPISHTAMEITWLSRIRLSRGPPPGQPSQASTRQARILNVREMQRRNRTATPSSSGPQPSAS